MDSPNRPKPGLPDISQTRRRDLPAAEPLATRATPGPGLGNTPGGRLGNDVVLVPGQVIAERYEVRGEIGRGGMGVVYAAFDRVRGEDVAMKVLQAHLLLDPQAKARFTAEAAAATRLGHPNVVRVYDSHEADGLTFLTMELLEGCSLRAEITRRTAEYSKFSVEEVRQFAAQLCSALGHAHSQDVVHRDVKPENIWLGADGTVKLMDFGIARLLRPSQFTSTGMALGTAYYMAPEQLKGRTDLDHRTDQYAVAVVLYELLTGDVPQGAIKPPHAQRRDVPESLSRAIMKALEGQPQDRYGDMVAFLAALQQRGRSQWPRWVAAGTVGAGLTAAGVVFAIQYFDRPPVEKVQPVVVAPQPTGPTREQAQTAIIRAETAHQSLAAAVAELPECPSSRTRRSISYLT